MMSNNGASRKPPVCKPGAWTQEASGGEAACGLEEPAVIRAAQEYLAALEQGRPPSRSEFLQRYPDIAAALAECLDALELMNGAAVQFEPSGATPAEVAAGIPLGDFRIVREKGRGGMGVVYEAEQLSLGRRVALKILPLAGALDPRRLQRFKNEARAAAQLHHTNIVPVHYVGCERGVHFYAMQYIDGRTLAEVIDNLREQATGHAREAAPDSERTTLCARVPEVREAPSVIDVHSATTVQDLASGAATRSLRPRRRSPGSDAAFFRTVAQWGIEAAQALEHAHQLGVIHRDVKPGNLLIDGRGNLWVTDFGLAHIQGDHQLTMTGDLLGTLRYMSPEQAQGSGAAVDQRTDIYSLGVTLYELATLEPAFAGSDRQQLMRQIAYEEPRPPRFWNRAIPAELDTILLKAIEKTPADRYATAQDLANDLRRYLEHKPIWARRPSPIQWMRKWARRHHAVVTTAAVGLLLAVAVLAGAVGWVARDRMVRRQLAERAGVAALAEARQLQQEEKYAEALAAARRAEGWVEGADGLPELRQRVHDLLADLEMFKALEDVRLEQTAVKDGHFDIVAGDAAYANAFRNYGIDVDALDIEEAGARLRERTIGVPLAAALDNWAMVRKIAGKPHWQRLLAVARAADPDDWRCRLRRALADADRAELRQRVGRDLWALASAPDVESQAASSVLLLAGELRKRNAAAALDVVRRAQRRHRGDFWLNYDLAMALRSHKPPQPDEALRFAMAAVAIRPESPGAQMNLGVALGDKGELDESITCYRQAIVLKPDFAEAHNNIGTALCAKGAFDEAVPFFEDAVRLKTGYSEAQYNLSHALARAGRLRDALTAMRHAHELGLRDTNWHIHSEQCVQVAEYLVKLDDRLSRVLTGKACPVYACECLEMARMCLVYKRLPATSMRLYVQAFGMQPHVIDDPTSCHRYNAARAAALAGCGQGRDSPRPSDSERVQLRSQAFEWLRADLAAWRAWLTKEPAKARSLAVQQMEHWQRELDLTGVRDKAGLAKLPAVERLRWQRLWQDVAALHTEAGMSR
jgi:serine/threonine protein kinase/Tfp pilus assembly protein PilF